MNPEKLLSQQANWRLCVRVISVTWQRPPTNEEMEGLIRERIREEVYYQEALALGLDKDDIIIRRRLQQKMEFIAHDIAKQMNQLISNSRLFW